MSDADHVILTTDRQVVALTEVRCSDGKRVHSRGAHRVITQKPADHQHYYRVRFIDGFEKSLKRQEIPVLAHDQADHTGI